ncbi:MAG: cell division protein FtsL [Oscillospiraceae bacterium]|nr:cell division protein FtsL [Oscillospiraceae bacterium]
MDSHARALSYYDNGPAAPTIQAMVEAETRRLHMPEPKPSRAKKQIAKQKKVRTEEKQSPGISIFAILGTLFVAVLMVFVVLAQINYNETAAESVRLSLHINDLTEKYRALELSFESAVEIKEVERFARDELGMSRPDAGQLIIISSTPRDSAIIINSGDDRGIQGFGNFLKSLTEYFR